MCLLLSSILFIITGERASVFPIRVNDGKILVCKVKISYLFFSTICISLMMLCALRPFNETYDTRVYIEWLEEIAPTSLFQFNGRFRPGFELLSKIILLFSGSNYRIYFAVLVILNCIIVFKAISNIDQFSGISFVLYIGFNGLFYNYIVLRSGLALSFVLLSYSYLNKSRKKAFICLLIAVLFHETSLVVLGAYFFKRYLLPVKKNKLYLLTGISVLLYLSKIFDKFIYNLMLWIHPFLPSSWFHTYILYLDAADANYKISIYYLLCFFLTFLTIHFYSERIKEYESFLAINIIGQLGFSLFSANTIVGRLWDYMVPATFIFLFPKIFKGRKDSKLIYLFVFLMGIALYTRMITAQVPFFI